MTLPPGSWLPPFIQTLAIVANPIGFLETHARWYGEAFTTRILGSQSPPVVFLSDPEAIAAVFSTYVDAFEFGKVTHIFQPLVGNQSLIMQQGLQHQQQRQLLMPPLHREHLQSQGYLICQLVRKQMLGWELGRSLCIREEMAEISLQVILQVVFGLVPGQRYEQLQRLLSQLLEAITSPLYSMQFFFPVLQRDFGTWSPWAGFLQRMAEIDRLISAEIQDRRSQAQQNRTDVLSVLMQAQDDQGRSLSDQQLRDQLMTLLLLGHETTASALTWAFYWLHHHPDCLQRLWTELAPLGDSPDPLVCARLPYLNAVCQEALRVYPIALIAQPRTVQRPIGIGDYAYEPGTILVPCIYLAHRRSATYANPEQFQPDRFLQQTFSPYEFFPFGGENRSCIGMALSLFEMKLVLATVMSWYEFALTNDRPIRPVRRGITFVPCDRFRLTIVREREV